MSRTRVFLGAALGIVLLAAFTVSASAQNLKPSVSLNPSSMSFQCSLGGYCHLATRLTNIGPSTLTISSITVTSYPGPAFSETNNCPPTLAVNQFCTIDVIFHPIRWWFRYTGAVYVSVPLTVVDGNSFISNWAPSAGSTLADEVTGLSAQQPCINGNSQCLSPTGFTTAMVNFPNQRRNQFRGPGFFDSDLSVNKNFKITERVAFGLGANFYNVFNHPNFSNPDNNLADSTFGQITTTTAPPTGPYGAFFTGLPSGRIIQFQGKVVF